MEMASRGPDSKLKWKGWEAFEGLRDFLNFTVPDARRADPDPFAGALYQSSDRLQIDVPAPFGDVVSVADPAAELGAATTYFANLSHKTEIS
jgi:hypothetical protein